VRIDIVCTGQAVPIESTIRDRAVTHQVRPAPLEAGQRTPHLVALVPCRAEFEDGKLVERGNLVERPDESGDDQ